MEALIDLHTHSRHSDGTLAPAQLVALAAQRGVALLALTDHDTTAGLDEARAAAQAAGMNFVDGVEITAGWRGQEIHIVGLAIRPDAAGLQAHLARLLALRRARIAAIGAKLARHPRLAQAGRDVAAEVLARDGVPTRAHVARALVAAGMAATTQNAFDRWLGRGTAGHVPQEWPGIDAAVAAIRTAGGHAVLAHPQRYKLSSGALGQLCGEFREHGGAALETSLPGLSPNDQDRLARLARAHQLAGSSGSDFHEPGLAWRPLGRFAKLPPGIEPLHARLM
ncbi:MAG TPA: PHP domain-containing protein [Steroidobacteraceae bacterium]|nr:PHP domain-containing protein [Steroidobacteraceae bacterium]